MDAGAAGGDHGNEQVVNCVVDPDMEEMLHQH